MKVAIVGNGYILGKTDSAKEIDSADVVIRVNPELIVPEITGNKTDIVAFNDHRFNDYKKFNCKMWLIIGDDITDGVIKAMMEKYGYGHELLGYDYYIEQNIKIAGRLAISAPASPTMGARVIRKAREVFPYAEITVYGMDWYKHTYSYWYGEDSVIDPIHNFKLEEIVMRKYCKDNNITIEETVRKESEQYKTPVTKAEPVKQNIVPPKKDKV